MLYPYKFAWDDIRHVQSFVNYIMLEVILKSHKIKKPHLSSDVVIDKYWKLIVGVKDDLLLNPLSDLYVICKHIDNEKRKILKRAVLVNNRIEGLCEGKYEPVRYKDLKSVFVANDKEKEVPGLIKTICNNLYNQCLKRSVFIDKYDTLKSHYDKIVGKDNRCHTCGISTIQTKYNTNRDAFDHYLPKGVYPFVTVNFFNLVPTCSTCNESYKKKIDILIINKKRKKAFYPYTKDRYDIKVKVDLMNDDLMNMESNDIRISLTCDGYQEEVDNWNRIYGIEEQYKAFCCSFSITTYISTVISGQLDVKTLLSMLESVKEIDSNFLRLACLKSAIEKLGIR